MPPPWPQLAGSLTLTASWPFHYDTFELITHPQFHIVAIGVLQTLPCPCHSSAPASGPMPRRFAPKKIKFFQIQIRTMRNDLLDPTAIDTVRRCQFSVISPSINGYECEYIRSKMLLSFVGNGNNASQLEMHSAQQSEFLNWFINKVVANDTKRFQWISKWRKSEKKSKNGHLLQHCTPF